MNFGDLQQGNSGVEVEDLQNQLLALGYDVGATGADGVFGSDTDAAVRTFQRDAGLTVDGIVGVNTTAAIGQALAHNTPGEAVPAPIPGVPNTPAPSRAPAGSWLGIPGWVWYVGIGGAAYWYFFMRKAKV